MSRLVGDNRLAFVLALVLVGLMIAAASLQRISWPPVFLLVLVFGFGLWRSATGRVPEMPPEPAKMPLLSAAITCVIFIPCIAAAAVLAFPAWSNVIIAVAATLVLGTFVAAIINGRRKRRFG